MNGEAAFIAELDGEPDDEWLVDQEQLEYHRDLGADQLCAYPSNRSRECLFELLEGQGYLADQARWTNGFRKPGETVEQLVLPAAIEHEDWQRLVRYALVSFNLRGIAEALAEPEILTALVSSGRYELATNICLQLSDQLARVKAMAVVAGRMRVWFDQAMRSQGGRPLAPDEAGRLDVAPQRWTSCVEDICRELDSCEPPLDEAAARRHAEVICTVADEVGDLLGQRWSRWIDRLEPWPDQVEVVRIAVARCLCRVDGALASGVWQMVHHVASPELLEHGLVELLDGCAADQIASIVARVLELRAEAGTIWSIVIRFLTQQAEQAPEQVRRVWHQLPAAHPTQPRVPWTPELASAGGRLWALLEASELDALLAGIDEPAARASILVALLELHPAPGLLEQTVGALDEVSEPLARVHLMLRAALTETDETSSWQAGVVEVLGDWLRKARYRVAAEDLARFIDLVARWQPDDLRRQVEYLLWSPVGTSEILRALAEGCRSELAWGCLLTEVVSFAAAVAANEAEGIELRHDLAIDLAARLVEAGGGEQWIAAALDRLAPHEEDDLLAEVALAAARRGRAGLAADLVDRISSGRLRLLASLRTCQGRSIDPALLEPASLYRAMAETRVVDDELEALQPLLVLPTRPRAAARAIVSGVASPERRALALLDLAEHALAYDERVKRPCQRDPTAALLPLREGLSVGVDDARALELIPLLVRAGSRLGVKQEAAELREAVVQLLTSETAAWPVREALLDRVLAGLDALGSLGRGPAAWRHCASFLIWMLDLPSGAMPAAAANDRVSGWSAAQDTIEAEPDAVTTLRSRWHRVLPAVVAATDRLQEWVWLYLRHPVVARILFEHLPLMTLRIGNERLYRLWKWLDRHFQARGTRRLALGPCDGVDPETVSACWPWLDPRHRELIMTCLQPATARAETVRQRVQADGAVCDSPASERLDWIRAAALMTAAMPSRVIELAQALRCGPERTGLCHEMLRAGWIAGATPESEELLGMADLASADAIEAELRARAEPGDGDRVENDVAWSRVLVEGVARGVVDPLAGRHCEARWHLWRLEQSIPLGPLLAGAVSRALSEGGRSAGESALRWWIQQHLGPALGHERPAAGKDLQGMKDAAQASRSIEGALTIETPAATAASDNGADSGAGTSAEFGGQPAMRSPALPVGAGSAQEAIGERSGARLVGLLASWRRCRGSGPGLQLLGDPDRVARWYYAALPILWLMPLSLLVRRRRSSEVEAWWSRTAGSLSALRWPRSARHRQFRDLAAGVRAGRPA